MAYALRHKATGYYLSVPPSSGDFRYSPNVTDAVRFPSFEDAERERRKFFEFSGTWMTVAIEVSA
jgi:hypothetical protein